MRFLLLLVLLAGCESATQTTCDAGADSTCYYHFPPPPTDTLIPLPDSVG